MNKLKFLIAAFAITVSVLGIYSCAKESNIQNAEVIDQNVETRAGNGDCFDDLNPFIDCTETPEDVYSITLPQYPNCEFIVKLPTIKCFSGIGGSTFTLGTIISYTTSCPGVNQYYEDYLIASSNNTLTVFLNDIAAQLYQAITNQLTNNQAQINSNSITFNYYISSCSRSCLVELPKGDFSALVLTNSKCGSLCCKRTTEWVKVNGVWTEINTTLDLVEDLNCGTPQENCPSRTISSTSCYNTCDIASSF